MAGQGVEDGEMKRACCICKEEKSIEKFSRDRTQTTKISYKCKECFAAYKSKWQKDNPDKRNRYRIKYNEKKKKLDSIINNEAFVDLKDRFNNKCFKCGNTKDLSFDHHYPLSFGYGLSDVNAVLLCRSCNSSKGNRPPEIFYTKRELNKLKRIYDIGYGAKNQDKRGGQAVLFP